jgi:carbon-monoxide dehydrogenase small subunit
MKTSVHFRLNGRATTASSEPDRPLLSVLRGELGLTGAKYGCGIGACGACTVLVAGKVVRACRATIGGVAGKDVMTIEGLARTEGLHPLQQAFIDHGALQCGYCTPGMLIASQALLNTTPNPDEAQIRNAIGGNLCRCTGYRQIVDAVKLAAEKLAQKK